MVWASTIYTVFGVLGCWLSSPIYQAAGCAVCAELGGKFVNRNFSRLNKCIFGLRLYCFCRHKVTSCR